LAPVGSVSGTPTEIVRELYGDFGPTLAQERLRELHGVRVAKNIAKVDDGEPGSG
jgi:hypothetical protein